MPINPNAAIEITALQLGARRSRRAWSATFALAGRSRRPGLDYRVRLLERASGRPNISQEQPFDQVPCFNDGKVQIFESGAIVQYIGEKSEALLPRDRRATTARSSGPMRR